MQRDIQVRRPELDVSEAIPRYWYGGDAFRTHFFDALSSVFPEGEAFFVRSVRHHLGRIADPELRRAVAAFSGQEGQHSHQHDRHVALLVAQGYRLIAWRNRLVGRLMRWNNRRLPRASLAATAALEHLTALLARQTLTRPEWTAPMDPRMAPLWQWHALEEAEHKAVAYDVLMQVAPSHALRVFTGVANTVGLFLETFDRLAYMLWVDGLLFRWRVWRDGLRWLFGHRGLLRGFGAEYLAWFRRDFHPDQIDDGPMIERWRDKIRTRAA